MQEVLDGVAAFEASGATIGGDAAIAATKFSIALRELSNAVSTAATMPKPSTPEALQAHFSEVVRETSAIEALTQNRSSLALHVKAVADAVPALFWVTSTHPAQHVAEYRDTMMFTGNKIMQNAKNTELSASHVAFVKILQALLVSMEASVKAKYPAGLTWGSGGSQKSTTSTGAAPSSYSAALEDLQRLAGDDEKLCRGVQLSKVALDQWNGIVSNFERDPSLHTTAAVEELGKALEALAMFSEENRRHTSFAHLEVLQLLTAICGWVAAPQPITFSGEQRDILMFSVNRLMSRGDKPWGMAVRSIADTICSRAQNHRYGIAAPKSTASATSAAPPAGTPTAAAGTTMESCVTPISALSAAIGIKVDSIVALACAQDAFLAKAAKTRKPDDPMELMEEMSRAMQVAVGQLEDFTRSNPNFSTHYDALQQLVGIFNWVCASQPADHAEESASTAEFYLNKVMTQQRTFTEHVEWAKSVRTACRTIAGTIKKNFPRGVLWGEAPPRAGPPKGPPPPPPPPPPRAVPSGTTTAAQALFAEISGAGVDITKRLRHVTDEEKKRPTPSSSSVATSRRVKKSWSPPSGERDIRLEGDKRWTVAYVASDVDRVEVSMSDVQRHHAINLHRCVNALIRIPSKFNTLHLTECLDVQVEILDTIGPVEIAGSEQVEILILGAVPSVILGKVNGAIIHLAGSTSTEFVTSCTSSINVTYTTEDSSGDRVTVELPIPEQYESVIGKRNKLITTITEHCGSS